MARNHRTLILCPICQKNKRPDEVMNGQLVRRAVVDLISEKHPDWTQQDVICLSCLNHIRADYVEDLLEKGKGELSELETEVVNSLREQEKVISENINVEFDRQLTLGERVADKIAEYGGSWRFIISFGVSLVVWIAVNSWFLLSKPFDPYPYILLNLVLSCVAAFQAPVIMMSQNRQEAKDRLRAEHDYRVNLKAELEIRLLHGKMDQLLTHHWGRLLEIQQIQMQMLDEFGRKTSKG
ncbi:MAG: DUF1003 domain-containing protein [Candidatus Tectomicrobia bacterium]|nr:DUF1003 domain-containing protein [Candidatus Tectomicrobia bacterium]